MSKKKAEEANPFFYRCPSCEGNGHWEAGERCRACKGAGKITPHDWFKWRDYVKQQQGNRKYHNFFKDIPPAKD
jgi:hypothetical protein